MKNQYYVRMYKTIKTNLFSAPSIVTYADVAILSTSPEAALARCEEIFGDHLEFELITPDAEHVVEWFQVGGGLVAVPKE